MAEVLVMPAVVGRPAVSLQSGVHVLHLIGLFFRNEAQLWMHFLFFLQVVHGDVHSAFMSLSFRSLSSPLGAQFLLLNVGLIVELASPREYHWLGKAGWVLKDNYTKISCIVIPFGLSVVFSPPSLCLPTRGNAVR